MGVKRDRNLNLLAQNVVLNNALERKSTDIVSQIIVSNQTPESSVSRRARLSSDIIRYIRDISPRGNSSEFYIPRKKNLMTRTIFLRYTLLTPLFPSALCVPGHERPIMQMYEVETAWTWL